MAAYDSRRTPLNNRARARKTFKAYDGINNVFNLAYEMLSWKVHLTLIKAKLEPYLSFLHSLAEVKPSLICNFIVAMYLRNEKQEWNPRILQTL
jgi:CRISPR/Cas system-associated endonuclease Cas1